VEKAQDVRLWSVESMYTFLRTMHERGDQQIVRDPATRLVLHRYVLPFKANMCVPPKQEELFKWRKAARRLSQWLYDGGLQPMHPKIVAQQPPVVVPPLPLAAQREARRVALWSRVAQRANQRALQSVRGDDADAQETRAVVSGVMDESQELSEEEANELEADLERELEQQQQQQDDQPIPVMAERIGPAEHEQQLFHIQELIAEMHET